MSRLISLICVIQKPILRNCLMTFDACRFAFVSSLLLLAACQSPTTNAPDFEQVLVPELRGQLSRGSSAMSGARLLLSRNEGAKGICERPLANTITDDLGNFQFDAITKRSKPTAPKKLENDWQVCLEQDDGARQIFYDRHAGVMWSGEKATLECDLNRRGGSRNPVCVAQSDNDTLHYEIDEQTGLPLRD